MSNFSKLAFIFGVLLGIAKIGLYIMEFLNPFIIGLIIIFEMFFIIIK